MPRGAPDYGVYERPAIAEQTFWEDTFESPVLRWGANSSAGSPNPVLSQVQQWKGIQSVHFATVAGIMEWGTLTRQFPFVRPGKVGVGFFTLLESRTPGYLQLGITIRDGNNISIAYLQLDRQARTATITTPAGPVVVANNCFPAIPLNCWIPVKLVVNTNTDMYDRLFIGPQSIDLSTHALTLGVATTDSMINIAFLFTGDIAGDRDAYLDDFILSQNEP